MVYKGTQAQGGITVCESSVWVGMLSSVVGLTLNVSNYCSLFTYLLS